MSSITRLAFPTTVAALLVSSAAVAAENEEEEPPWEIIADIVRGATTSDVNSRRVFAPGNLELGARYVLAKGERWNLTATLELALPTASGKELPPQAEVVADPAARYDYRSFDKAAAVHAGAAVRGAYESAMFEPRHFGVIPKLSAIFEFGRLTLAPMAKIENLIDLDSAGEELYINELVVGVRVSRLVIPALEPGVHIWMRELHEHTHVDDSYSVLGVVEPYAVVHFDGVEELEEVAPVVSAIVPFSGDLVDADTFGVRLSVLGRF